MATVLSPQEAREIDAMIQWIGEDPGAFMLMSMADQGWYQVSQLFVQVKYMNGTGGPNKHLYTRENAEIALNYFEVSGFIKRKGKDDDRVKLTPRGELLATFVLFTYQVDTHFYCTLVKHVCRDKKSVLELKDAHKGLKRILKAIHDDYDASEREFLKVE